MKEKEIAWRKRLAEIMLLTERMKLSLLASDDIMDTDSKKGEETMSKIHGYPGFFGGEDFYDENGQNAGYSVPGLFGGQDFYDADGKPAGYSVDSIISGENYYDRNGQLGGYSVEGLFGGHDYYDADGKPIGYSVPGLFGGEDVYLDSNPFHNDPPRTELDPDDFDSYEDFLDAGGED